MTAEQQPSPHTDYGIAKCRRIIADMPHLPITLIIGPDASESTRYADTRAIRLTPGIIGVTAQWWQRGTDQTWQPTGVALRIPYPALSGPSSQPFGSAIRAAVETLAADLNPARAAA